jgi:hypothetical protein
LTAELLAALTSREARPLTPCFETPADDLEQAIQNLVSAFDVYAVAMSARD